jgi:hypothetical protein
MALSNEISDYAYQIGDEDGEAGTKLTQTALTRHLNSLIHTEELDYSARRLSSADAKEAYEFYLNSYFMSELKRQEEQEKPKEPQEQITWITPLTYVIIPKRAMRERDEEGIYWVVSEKLDRLDELIKKYTKKAQRMGLPAPSYTIVGQETLQVREVDTRYETQYSRPAGYFVEFTRLYVEGDAPTFKGWEFLATIKPIAGSDKALLLTVPDVELPAKVRNALVANPYKCDHCKKSRRRNETFALYNEEEGVYKQVGRSCIKDFLGHKSPQDIAAYFGFFKTIHEELEKDPDIEGSGGSIPLVVRTDAFFAQVYKDWKDLGGYEKGLGMRAVMAFWDRKLKPDYSDSDLAKSKEIRAWILERLNEKNENALTGYEYNVKTALESPYLGRKEVNIAGSAIIMYERTVGRPGEEKEEKKESQWIGEVRDKLSLTVTCVKTKWIESMYGTSQLCIFLDDEGNELKWFNSGRTEAEIDTRYHLTGTIKKHEDYRGQKSTLLTRCKIKPV